jgi:hypothetical protein
MNVDKVYDTDSMALPTATFCNSILISFMLDKKIKHSRYRPGVAQRVPGS